MAKVLSFTPENPEEEVTCRKVFLSGTIDNGDSANWQDEVVNYMKNFNAVGEDLCIYNPRRKHWGELEKRDMNHQITWELNHQEECDLNVMVLLENSKSPISFMELGLFARTGKLIVLCSEKFYRYDNVEVVCKRYGVPLYVLCDGDWPQWAISYIIVGELEERYGFKVTENCDITYFLPKK